MGRKTEASPKDKRQTKVNHSRHTHLQWHFKCGRKWKQGKAGEDEEKDEEEGEEEKRERHKKQAEVEAGEAQLLSRRWMSSVGVTIVVCAAAAIEICCRKRSLFGSYVVFKCRRTVA